MKSEHAAASRLALFARARASQPTRHRPAPLPAGVNGCSLKTEDNLSAVAAIPEHRLLIETDSPWCGVRPTHASACFAGPAPPARDKKKHDAALQVKGRNEPCNLRQVLLAVAGAPPCPA
jgi:Tat protein secretion system quality control protein TatD with DNase activity